MARQFDLEIETISRLAGHERARSSTGRTARPVLPGFHPWLAMRRLRPKVNFVWSRAAERHVRTMPVIPELEIVKLTTKCHSAEGNDHPSSAFVFQCEDQPLHHGDAAVFADGSVAGWLDAFTFHPASECIAMENAVPVADDVLWRSPYLTDRVPQHRANRAAVGVIGKDSKLHDPPRIVIDNHRTPPAKGPALW